MEHDPNPQLVRKTALNRPGMNRNRLRDALSVGAALLCAASGGVLNFFSVRADFTAGLGPPLSVILADFCYGACTGRRHSPGGLALSVLLSLLCCGVGAYLGYAAIILDQNRAFGCTWADALALTPDVIRDPVNAVRVRYDLLALFGSTAVAAAGLLGLRRNKPHQE